MIYWGLRGVTLIGVSSYQSSQPNRFRPRMCISLHFSTWRREFKQMRYYTAVMRTIKSTPTRVTYTWRNIPSIYGHFGKTNGDIYSGFLEIKAKTPASSSLSWLAQLCTGHNPFSGMAVSSEGPTLFESPALSTHLTVTLNHFSSPLWHLRVVKPNLNSCGLKFLPEGCV